LVADKNVLRDKILGIDKSLRDVYSIIIARVEAQRRGQAEEQIAKKQAQEKLKAEQNEQVQRAQWSGKEPNLQSGFLKQAPSELKQKFAIDEKAEQEQRKKFLEEVEKGANQTGGPQQKSNT
jgi:hypothetical protein